MAEPLSVTVARLGDFTLQSTMLSMRPALGQLSCLLGTKNLVIDYTMNPANTRRSPNAGVVLRHSLRLWSTQCTGMLWNWTHIG